MSVGRSPCSARPTELSSSAPRQKASLDASHSANSCPLPSPWDTDPHTKQSLLYGMSKSVRPPPNVRLTTRIGSHMSTILSHPLLYFLRYVQYSKNFDRTLAAVVHNVKVAPVWLFHTPRPPKCQLRCRPNQCVPARFLVNIPVSHFRSIHQTLHFNLYSVVVCPLRRLFDLDTCSFRRHSGLFHKTANETQDVLN